MRESTITFCLALILIEWDFEGVGVSTGAKRTRWRIHIYVRKISRGGGGDGTKRQACHFIGNLSSDGQPVQMSEYWYDVNMWRCMDYKMGCSVLDPLKFGDQGNWYVKDC